MGNGFKDKSRNKKKILLQAAAPGYAPDQPMVWSLTRVCALIFATGVTLVEKL